MIVVGLKKYYSTVFGPSAPEQAIQVAIATAAAEEEDGATPIAETEAQADPTAQEQPHENEQGGGEFITEFSPEHIIADLGIRIPIESFIQTLEIK